MNWVACLETEKHVCLLKQRWLIFKIVASVIQWNLKGGALRQLEFLFYFAKWIKSRGSVALQAMNETTGKHFENKPHLFSGYSICRKVSLPFFCLA